MRFKIFSVMFALIAAAGISANAAELYISSDTTDVYNEYNAVVSEVFDGVYNYKNSDIWNITGTHSFSDRGLIFPENELVGSLMYGHELDGSYVIKTKLYRDYKNGVRLIFGYKDENNYLYLENNQNPDNPDFTEYNTKLITIIDGEKTVLAQANTEDDITCIFTEFEITVKDGRISASYTITNTKMIFSEVCADNTSGSAGIRFMSSPGTVKTFDVFELNNECPDNIIKGCVVSYENSGTCKAVAAFYDDSGILAGIHISDVSVTDSGKNYFEIPVNGNKEYIGADRKYFLLKGTDSLVPLADTDSISDYRESGFSDSLEPYYPNTTAYTLSAEEINERITVGELPEDEVYLNERMSVIELYRTAGFDISIDLQDWMNSSVMSANAPQRFSRLTPEPLTGEYKRPYSVDAPWNNKIPADNPSVLLETWSSRNYGIQIGTVNNKINSDGNGQGTPVIIGTENDPEYTLASKAGVDSVKKGYLFRAPSDFSDYINYKTTGDEHVIFIDDKAKTSMQTIGFRAPDYIGGYSINNGLLPHFDTRANATTYDIDLTGMGNDGYSGTNAAGLPLNAFIIRPSELEGEDDINHALAGSLNNMMKARVYPAVSMDYWVSVAEDNENLTGNVPYGGIIRLSPETALEELYENQKLSRAAYKVLKAWRDYGFYNIDAGANTDTLLLYTSTENSDWSCDVPYNGGSSMNDVEAEIRAFLAGDGFFGTEKPQYYLTIPVAKYTELDVNADGNTDEADYELISNSFTERTHIKNYRCDVNKDGAVDSCDAQILKNYLENSVQHTFDTNTITCSQTYGGIVTVSNSNPKNGQYVCVSAIPDNGYSFVGWEGEFEEETNNVIRFIPERDYTVSAVFEKAPDCVLEISTDGSGEVFATDTKWGYTDTPQSAYGKNSLIALKAVPVEGYVFSHWEGDIESGSDIIGLLITQNTTIKAVFKQVDFYEDFSSQNAADSWEAVLGDASGAEFFENYVGFTVWSNMNDIILARNTMLNSGNGFDMTAAGRLSATGIGTGNKGIVVFGYNDGAFYCVDFSSDARFRLLRYSDEKYTVLKDFGILEKINPTSIMYIHADYTPSDGISIMVSQGIQSCKLLQNDTGLISGELSGSFGVGSNVLAAVVYDSFLVDIK